MEQLKRITNSDKVTLALLLEEGKARIAEIQFHVTLTRSQIRLALNSMMENGVVRYEPTTSFYSLI